MRKLLLLILAAAILLSSCSFSRGEDDEAQEKGEYPDISLTGARYTLGQSGERPVYIESSRMLLYSKDSRAVVEDVTFISYDEEGNPSVEGSADHGDIETDTKRMMLEGNVKLRASDGNMTIEADTLMFDSENGEVEADGDVLVSSDDGTFRGTGFRGDLKEEAYAFRTISEGVFEL